jgi:lipoate-protein ligase B
MAESRLQVETHGLVPFADALELQRKRVEAVRAGAAPETLFLLEHPTVITLGRSARSEHLLADATTLAARGITVHEAGRGGDVTLHAPGQLVGYLVCDLEARGAADVTRFLRGIEAALVLALAECGVAGASRPGRTGVFVAETSRKIASIGVGLRGWTTFHGFALNVTNDLSLFDYIVPCGLRDVTMTSVAQEHASDPGRVPNVALFSAAQEAVAAAFQEWLK